MWNQHEADHDRLPRPHKRDRRVDTGDPELTRPIWIAVLLAVLGVLVAIFARFEWRISDEPAPTHRRWVTLGVLLTAGAAAAVSYFGLATEDAVIN